MTKSIIYAVPRTGSKVFTYNLANYFLSINLTYPQLMFSHSVDGKYSTNPNGKIEVIDSKPLEYIDLVNNDIRVLHETTLDTIYRLHYRDNIGFIDTSLLAGVKYKFHLKRKDIFQTILSRIACSEMRVWGPSDFQKEQIINHTRNKITVDLDYFRRFVRTSLQLDKVSFHDAHVVYFEDLCLCKNSKEFSNLIGLPHADDYEFVSGQVELGNDKYNLFNNIDLLTDVYHEEVENHEKETSKK